MLKPFKGSGATSLPETAPCTVRLNSAKLRTNHPVTHLSEKLLISFATTLGVVLHSLSFLCQLNDHTQLAYKNALASLTFRALSSSYLAH